jgi:hypothetical protein
LSRPARGIASSSSRRWSMSLGAAAGSLGAQSGRSHPIGTGVAVSTGCGGRRRFRPRRGRHVRTAGGGLTTGVSAAPTRAARSARSSTTGREARGRGQRRGRGRGRQGSSSRASLVISFTTA